MPDSKKTEQPLVSVLMTVYNREQYVADAIESVLASTYKNFELIIVDDCSTDGSYKIVQELAGKDERIKVYKNEENLGDYPNRSKAAGYAKGKYLKYCDSDEQLYPYCLEIMVDGMERYPNGALGLSQIHDDRMLPYEITPEDAYKRHFLNKHFFHNAPTSTIIRRKEFEALGGFNPIRHRGDYDLWLRIGAKYNVVRLPAILTFHFKHEGQEQGKNLLYKKSLNYNISLKALQSEDCPLNEDDRAKAIHRLRRSFVRQHILIGLYKLKFKEVKYLLANTDIKLFDIFKYI